MRTTMSNSRSLWIAAAMAALLLAVPAVGQAQYGGSYCDGAALQGALDAASPGDVVHVGACTVSAPLTVPDGVTLSGVERRRSVVSAGPGTVGVTLGDGATVERLTIQSAGRAAVVAWHLASASVRHVTIGASLGIGIGAENVGTLEVRDVALTGPVTSADAESISAFVLPSLIATHGVAMFDVNDAELRGVTVRGFARTGVLASHSTTHWSGGWARGNVDVGMLVWGGEANLDHVTLDNTYKPVPYSSTPGELSVPAGLVFEAGAQGSTRDVSAEGNEGWGVFQDSTGVVVHSRLRALHNQLAGVWVQNAEYVQLDRAFLAHNPQGLVAVDTTLVSLLGGQATQNDDGIQLVGTAADLWGVRLRSNDRIGLIADLAPTQSVSDLRFFGVTVAGGRGDLGLLAQQSGALLPLITRGVFRLGRTAAADAAYVDVGSALGVAEGVIPCFLVMTPNTINGGLVGLIGNGQISDNP